MGRSLMAPGNPYGPNVLYYIPSLNRFLDANWVIVHDLHTLFNTWQLMVWKRNERDDLMVTRDGIEMMVYYLTDEEEDDVFDFLGYQDSFGVRTDRLCY